MKKLYLLLILLFIPIFVLAESNVEIKSVELIEKSENVEELESATSKDLKLNFNLKFKQINDYAKYKVVLKNNTNKDYAIDNTSSFNEKEFIRYDFILKDNNETLKANEEIELMVNISYVKELEKNSFVDGKYVERNNVSLELLNDIDDIIDSGSKDIKDSNEEKPIIKFITNPETGAKDIISMVIVLSILSIVLKLLIKNKKAKIFIISLSLLIPITIYALEKIKIEVETYVEIDGNSVFMIKTNICESNDYISNEYNFKYGMTFEDYINSSSFNTEDEYYFNRIFYDKKNLSFSSKELENCINSIERPSEDLYNENMDEYYRLEDLAEDKVNACFNNYKIENIKVTDLIESVNDGIYYFIDSDKCLN